MTNIIKLMRYPTDEDWMMCKAVTLSTVGKESTTPPTSEWKHKILEARHSPIRLLNYYFKLIDIPYYVSVHLCRHSHSLPFVSTQRTDRTGIDRNNLPQNAPVTMWYVVNAEELQVIANKRLCNQASLETRQIVQRMCCLAEEATPELHGLLVPMCEYGRCHEMFPCGRADKDKAEPRD